MSSNQQPTTNNQQQITNNQQPTTNNQQPTTNNQQPTTIKPGDLVRVVAPSGAIEEREIFDRGVAIWRERGYQVELEPNVELRCGYLAGKDRERREALTYAWNDPECKAILCARGGYGATRLLEDWQWQTQDSPKWLIGFSDVTALLWSLAKEGIPSIHGPVLTTLAKEPHWSMERLFHFLEGGPLPALEGKGWGGGQATGMLLAGNLTVATSMLGTSWQPDLNDVILALEDVAEAPYKVDRMLTQWRMMGAFRGVRGIALGRFSNCDGSPGSWTVEDVFRAPRSGSLRERLSDLNIPIISDLPFGHDGVNAALLVGVNVTLDGDKGMLSW